MWSRADFCCFFDLFFVFAFFLILFDFVFLGMQFLGYHSYRKSCRDVFLRVCLAECRLLEMHFGVPVQSLPS